MLKRMVPSALRGLAANSSGIAFTEFALALPVLLTLGLGGLEIAHYALAIQECSQIAMTAADNASRVRISIDETDVNDVLTGAKLVGTNIGFAANGRIILSDLEQSTSDTTKQWIRWQRCSGAKNVTSSYGTPNAMSSSTMTAMGPTGNQIAATTAPTAVMFVQVSYAYQPLISNIWIGGARTINTTSAFNVRQRTDQTLYNTSNLSTSQISSCSTFSA
ncbi:MAG: pilus assembly protein [Sphingomonadaceae bacterium]|nr:pilus assembly protein [Sphingomonadaceae bacterium]